MISFYKKYTVCALLIILSACAMPNKDNFDATVNEYYGMKVDELVSVWGPPTASYVNNDNSHVYQWIQEGGSVHFPGASYPWIGAGSHAYGPWNHALWPAWHGGFYNPGIGMVVSRPMIIDRSCTLNIFANNKNIITKHQSMGAGCVAD